MAICGLALAIVLWAFFAPTKLGGSVTYAITDGISMQPLLYKNDLALIRPQTTYRVGDVVMYQSQLLHQPVLHRIYLIQSGKYYFKGDNNGFIDPGYATRSEILGKLWIHIPWVGAVLGWFAQPLHAAILAGFAFMLIFFGFSRSARDNDRNRQRNSRSRTRRGMVNTP